jgi:hypothetical protein
MLTNNASFSVGIPAVFKRYYTVMCLKHLIFFFAIHPAVSYFISHPSIVLRVVPASGLSSLNSTPLIALSLCHCCASSQSFENYLHLAHTKLCWFDGTFLQSVQFYPY